MVKSLITPDATEGDEYRFAHALVHDAAYEVTSKRTRAALHERAADWLSAGDMPGPKEELIGYHLEQAYKARIGLGQQDARSRRLAVRGGEALAAAGRSARDRDDHHAACALFDRATRLLPDERVRLPVVCEQADALYQDWRFEDAVALLERAQMDARRLDDQRVLALS